ncbi:MAG: c-type cytochrome [Rhodanobacteraceae bacterium]
MYKSRWLDSGGQRRVRGFSAARIASMAIVTAAVLSFATTAFAQAPDSVHTPDAAQVPDRKGMETRLAACAFCHGKQGQGDLDRRGGVYPRLAGQPAGYLYEQMSQFVSGARTGIPPVVVMRRLLENLTPDYMQRIAEFYQNSTPAYPPPVPASAAKLQEGRELVERGVPAQHIPACTTCHGPNLEGQAPEIPALAGQNDRYLTVQFMHWILDQRRNPLHQRIAHTLSEQQVQAVSAYLSSLRPQSADALK